MSEIKMPTHWESMKRTAAKLMLGVDDLENLVAAGMSLLTFTYSVGSVLIRVVLFLLLPLSVLLLYPAMRANHRRWYQWAQSERLRRSELIAELTKECAKPVEWPHDWPNREAVSVGWAIGPDGKRHEAVQVVGPLPPPPSHKD